MADSRTVMLPAATRVTEIALTVADLARAARFYTMVLGLDVVDEPPGSVRLGAGDHAFLRLDERRGAAPAPVATGLFHFAILYPTRRDLASVVDRLVGLRHPLQGAADHLVSEAVYLADPEGNGIEVYRDRPREDWPVANGMIEMATDPLDLRALLAEAARPETWTIPSATRLGHVHLRVADIPAAERFYIETLGFDLTSRYGRQASFFSAGGYHHHVAVNTWQTRGAPPPPEGAQGLKWFRIEVPSAEALAAARASLEAAGVTVGDEDGVLRSQDPAGNGLVVSVH